MVKPKVGVIGKGNVGSALKRGLERAGYQVRTVRKDPKGVSETARWGDVIVLAVPFFGLDETLREMGREVDGKTLVDVTNLYTPEMLAAVGSKSGAEELQRKAPGAKVVKAFNMHFAKNMENGRVGGQQLTVFVAGDDKDAKASVLELSRDIGFDAVDAGPLQNARFLESLGSLNIQLGYTLGLGTNIGFKLIRA